MAQPKRSWKLQEYVAHVDNVNCLGIGHKSGRVMVTGGEDKKVNMWTVGKPNCIMSLSGHTSPVEAVRFGTAEEVVVAGSMSGALKIWDLEAAKIIRTLTGHTSNIRSLDFHPYGDFVASGSMDTNIKLWDIRRKGCIFTYKGHTKCVNTIRFSPDGRWIASAGEDGILKLWDLTAGKLLNDFSHHDGPVTTAEFHPSEFLLTSGSADRTVKFWDLETFELVSSTDGETSPVRCILYHPEGRCIYSGSNDLLRVYGWEPACVFDSLNLGWGKVADMAITHNQLIGATFHQSNVSTFVVDIEQVQPLGGAPNLPVSPPTSSSGRRSFLTTERPQTQSTKQTPKEEPEQATPLTYDPGDDKLSLADIQNPEDYEAIFKPKNTLAREAVRKSSASSVSTSKSTTKTSTLAPKATVSKPSSNKSYNLPNSSKSSNNRPTTTKPPRVTGVVSNSNNKRPNSSRQRSNSPAAAAGCPREPEPSSAQNAASFFEPAILDDFIPKPASGDRGSITDTDALASIDNGHDSMVTVLASRQRNLQIVRALYTGGNMKNALDSAIGMGDQAIIVDILEILVQKSSLWNLDICSMLLPKIKDLMNSKYDKYVEAGCNGLKVVLKNFAIVIKTNVTAPPSHGVDISREERYHKCKHCYGLLMDIRCRLDEKRSLPQLRELQLLMGQLD